jgi:hypothetical protein
VLKKNDPAPFTGVLVWGPLWRNNKTDLDICLYDTQHATGKANDTADAQAGAVWPWLSATLLLGFVAGLSVHR